MQYFYGLRLVFLNGYHYLFNPHYLFKEVNALKYITGILNAFAIVGRDKRFTLGTVDYQIIKRLFTLGKLDMGGKSGAAQPDKTAFPCCRNKLLMGSYGDGRDRRIGCHFAVRLNNDRFGMRAAKR